MGFRDLFAVNLVVLAKQGWRIAQQTGSLEEPFFKARYFPMVSFWEAPIPKSGLYY